MSDLLLSRLDEYGVLIVFATVVAGQIGIPIPAIAILMGAGAFAGEDRAAALAFAVSAPPYGGAVPSQSNLDGEQRTI